MATSKSILKERQATYFAESDEKALAKQKHADTSTRFRYLLGLTDLFRHFIDERAKKDPVFKKIVAEADRMRVEGSNVKSQSANHRRRKTEKEEDIISCNIKGLSATGYLTPNGIVVLKGSQAVLKERDSAHKWPSVMAQRNKLIEEGSIVEQNGAYVFTKDIEFSSPSSAAATIHGGSANGLTAWVNSNGVQLKNLQNV